VGDPRQHKKADPNNNHNPGRRAPPVRWRLGDSIGEIPERVSGAEHAYHYEGQAGDQQHPRAHSSPLPIDIHDMTLCGEGPVVSRRDSVAISLSCEWRSLGATDHMSGFRTVGRAPHQPIRWRTGEQMATEKSCNPWTSTA
jgi:hypothetical protein